MRSSVLILALLSSLSLAAPAQQGQGQGQGHRYGYPYGGSYGADATSSGGESYAYGTSERGQIASHATAGVHQYRAPTDMNMQVTPSSYAGYNPVSGAQQSYAVASWVPAWNNWFGRQHPQTPTQQVILDSFHTIIRIFELVGVQHININTFAIGGPFDHSACRDPRASASMLLYLLWPALSPTHHYEAMDWLQIVHQAIYGAKVVKAPDDVLMEQVVRRISHLIVDREYLRVLSPRFGELDIFVPSFDPVDHQSGLNELLHTFNTE